MGSSWAFTCPGWKTSSTAKALVACTVWDACHGPFRRLFPDTPWEWPYHARVPRNQDQILKYVKESFPLCFMETLRFLSAQNGLPTVARSAKRENGLASDLSLSVLCWFWKAIMWWVCFSPSTSLIQQVWSCHSPCLYWCHFPILGGLCLRRKKPDQLCPRGLKPVIAQQSHAKSVQHGDDRQTQLPKITWMALDVGANVPYGMMLPDPGSNIKMMEKLLCQKLQHPANIFGHSGPPNGPLRDAWWFRERFQREIYQGIKEPVHP